MEGGGRVIEPGPCPEASLDRQAGRRPEILVRRAAHSPRSRRCYNINQSRKAARASHSKRAWLCATCCASASCARAPCRTKPRALRFEPFPRRRAIQPHAPLFLAAFMAIPLFRKPRSTKPGGFWRSGLRGNPHGIEASPSVSRRARVWRPSRRCPARSGAPRRWSSRSASGCGCVRSSLGRLLTSIRRSNAAMQHEVRQGLR